MNENITFDISDSQRERLGQARDAIICSHIGQDEDEDVATDVTAFSAYNCAWLPPVTRETVDE